MLTPEEFPHIGAHLGPGEPGAALPVEPPKPIEAQAIEIAEPASSTEPAERIAVFDQDGDVRPLAEIEAAMIKLALERYRGRMTLVARKLGIGRSTLYRKLKELGLSDMAEGIAAE
jgi:DNA-binding NtrC family response regulator